MKPAASVVVRPRHFQGRLSEVPLGGDQLTSRSYHAMFCCTPGLHLLALTRMIDPHG